MNINATSVALTVTTYAAQTTDPHWSSVDLLLRFNGNNGSTTFVDESPNQFSTVSVVGAVAIATSGAKYGSGCGTFGGGDYFLEPDNAVFDLSSSTPWTLDYWVNTAITGNIQTVISKKGVSGGNLAWQSGINGTGLAFLAMWNTSKTPSSL